VLVDDLVRGHLLAMERGRVGERYILGGANASLRDLLALVDRLDGTRHATVNLPGALASAYAHVAEAGARWLGIYPRITPGWVRTFLHDWAFSSANAVRELGYSITPLEEGLRRTLAWLRNGRRPGTEGA
jgi:nucleoside-diphosphate-sugar epimerase